MKLADRLAGKKINCPDCAAAVEVPFAPLDPTAAAPTVESDSSGSFRALPAPGTPASRQVAEEPSSFFDGFQASDSGTVELFATPAPAASTSKSKAPAMPASTLSRSGPSPSPAGSSARSKPGSAVKAGGKVARTGKKGNEDDDEAAARQSAQRKTIAIIALSSVAVILVIVMIVFSTMRPKKTVSEQAKDNIKKAYSSSKTFGRFTKEIFSSIDKHHEEEFKQSFTGMNAFDQGEYNRRMDERVKEDLIAQKLIGGAPGEWIPPEMPMSPAERGTTNPKPSPAPPSSTKESGSKGDKKKTK